MENQYQQGIIQIDNFQGPFDLLLALIKDKKLDIFEVNLVDVVNEYVKIIESLVNENVDLVSEYLVMAASLINLKATITQRTDRKQKSC
ncbi:segregation/condensation protein A [Mycoplasma sp. ATU-Cv-508]|uniref:segregation/condensation protein A n=1 Tax=Mycoplasma sp. ATU-Cv-508 TaxID=2048001 RepID=UPI000FDD7219